MAETVRNRFFDAVNDIYDAVLSVAETTELRGHKVSRKVFEDARKGERELVALARQWVEGPGNVFENLGAIIDAQARAERHALELARDALEGGGDYASDVRRALTRVIKANRIATEATVEVAREAAHRTVERVRSARGQGEAHPGRHVARTPRLPVAAGRAHSNGNE